MIDDLNILLNQVVAKPANIILEIMNLEIPYRPGPDHEDYEEGMTDFGGERRLGSEVFLVKTGSTVYGTLNRRHNGIY